jgi:hypothetical protein
MKYLKMYENFNSYKIGDVISDIYDINYILDDQNNHLVDLVSK